MRLTLHLLCLVLLSGFVLFVCNGISTEEAKTSWSIETTSHEASNVPTMDQGRSLREERLMYIPTSVQEKLAGLRLWKKLTGLKLRTKLASLRLQKKVKGSRLWKHVTESKLWTIVARKLLSMKSKAAKLNFVRMIASSWPVRTFAPSLYVRYAANKQMAVDDLFMRFKVGTEGSNPLASALFQKWFNVVHLADDDAGASMIATLVKHYRDSAKLSNMLTRAYETPATQETAEFLLRSLIGMWRRKNKPISEDRFYSLLRLDAKDVDFLKSPSLRTWLLLCEFSGMDTVRRHEFLLSKLLVHYDDRELDKMLAATINTGGKPAAVATMIRLQSWRMREFAAGKVYKLSKEANATKGNNLLQSDKADKADDVVDLKALRHLISFKYFKAADGMDFIKKLLKNANEEDIVRAILPPKIDDGLSDTLDYVSELLILHWLRSRVTAEEVFNRIGLNVDGDNLFENPVLSLWVSFVKAQDRKGAAKTMYEVIKKFYGNEEKLEKMIAHAKKSSSETARDLAALLNSQLYKSQG